MDTRSTVRVVISGHVQGVSFRWHARQKALELGLGGWVRNLCDGRVEAVFEGEDGAVRQMLSWCQYGPPAAEVDDVEASHEPPIGDSRGFHIR